MISKKNERWKIVLSYITLFSEKRGRDGGVHFFFNQAHLIAKIVMVYQRPSTDFREVAVTACKKIKRNFYKKEDLLSYL